MFAAPADHAFIAPGTLKMASRLEEAARAIQPGNSPWQSEVRFRYLETLLPRATNAMDRLMIQRGYAIEALNAGHSENAIEAFIKLREMLRRENPGFLTARNGENQRQLGIYLATSYLRLGEQDNCISNHTADSCLLPIKPAGVHTIPRGSQNAVRVLNELLTEFPKDLTARWLLNIAHMTLGEYPSQPAAPWLVPPSAFDSDYDIREFTDVAASAGLDANELSGGAIADDFDNDGFLDIVTSSIGFRDQVRFYRNDGDGTFSDATRRTGLAGEVGGLNALQADYNNDGFLDFFVLRGGWMGSAGHQPNSLLRNNGDGTFADVTEEAGLLGFHPTQTAVWLDFNGDGWLDLYVGNETVGTDRNPCELFRNNRDGTFKEVGVPSGVAYSGFVKAVMSADFNNDGRPDLYLSCLGEPNLLYRNDGPADLGGSLDSAWKFKNVAAEAGVEEPRASFPGWFFDFDNDGWEDLFVAGYPITVVGDVAADYLGLPSRGEPPRLYHNEGDGTFRDVTREAKLNHVLLAMGCNYGDLDNDGWLDFYVGTGNPDLSMLIPNRMFRNAGGKFFQDVTTSGRFGHLQKDHGVAFADFDHDGDQDIFENMGGAYTGDAYRNVLFKNPGHGNHWIKLQLEGVESNRSAIGARVTIAVENADGSSRMIRKSVRSGGSFGSSPLRQEIGLGQAKAIRNIVIDWPSSGQQQTFDSPVMDRFYRVLEGRDTLVPVTLRTFSFGNGGQPHAHHATEPDSRIHQRGGS